MKKLFLAAVALLVAANAMALEYEPEEGLSWQAVLGMNVSGIRGGIRIKNEYGEVGPFNTDKRIGIALGFRGEFMLPNAHGTYISYGLLWTQKGAKHGLDMPGIYKVSTVVSMTDENGEELLKQVTEDEGRNYSGKYKITSHYFYIPIHVGFRYNFSDDWGVFAEAGPYFALGVAGKTRFDADEEGTNPHYVEFKDKTFKKNSDNYRASGGLQRFDAGLGFRVGVECQNHYSLNLDCDWGLTDMLRGDYRDAYADTFSPNADKLKNFCISITFGYRF